MKAEEIVYNTTVSGYTVIYDKSEFISVFDGTLTEITAPNSSIQCVLRILSPCKTKKDFEMEIIYVNQKISEL